MDFRVLGPLEVSDDTRRIPLGGPKQRAVLAYLLTRVNQPVSPDRLIDELWREHATEAARNTLQSHISHLRKALGAERITTGPAGYALKAEPQEVDARRFERLVTDARKQHADDPDAAASTLEEALSLWRGPALADVADEPSLAGEITRLEEIRLTALEDRLAADLGLGRHRDVIPELEGLVARHPLRERLWAHLMLALYRSGRQADALSAFGRARRTLAEEIGVDPSTDLTRLHERILAQDPVLDPPKASAEATGTVQVSRPRYRGSLIRNHPVASLVAATALVVAAAVPLTLLDRGAVTEIGDDAVAIIDPRTGEIAGAIELDGRPGALVVGEGAVWVAQPDRGIVVRIDPDTRAVVDTIQVGPDPSAIAVSGGSVWVANAGGSSVSRISADTNSVVETVETRGGPVGIAVGGGALWIANALDDSVSRIEPEIGEVEASIAVGDRPSGIVVADDALWVTNYGSGTVSRIDAKREVEVATVSVGNGPLGLASGEGGIWIANQLDDTVSRIDPRTNAVESTIRVGGGPATVVLSGGWVWVANELDGTVSRIDPRSNEVESFAVGAETGGAAGVDGSLWVGVRAAEEAHRGGNLTVLVDYEVGSLDPATAYSGAAWSILSLTNDGLVAFKRAGGLEGTTLVPNLARSLPTPTEGGTTYTFQLRSGIRYSNGATVRPEDFRRAIERTLILGSPRADLYRSIVGAEGCLRQPQSCDLHQGIVVDEEANTVTFLLEAPDTEFLSKLALSFAFAVPPGAPDPDIGAELLPATGPYMIASSTPEQVELVRNPEFQEWSPAAQPEGFPDRIVWRFGVPAERAVEEVLAGRADVMFRPPPPDGVGRLMANNPGQMHTFPASTTAFAVLNLMAPPFNDVRARQAVNYAVDRQRVAELVAGGQARPTCQVLPPTFPQYEPYCPYTSRPGTAGIWTAPDPVRARDLVAASGTTGARVRVWAQRADVRGAAPSIARYLVKLLRELGYRSSLKVVDDIPRYIQEHGIAHPERRIHIFPRGWSADFPGDSTFLSLQLECGAPDNVNGFCDPRIDAMMDKARTLETTEPAAAAKLWAAVDRRIVDQAPWVPLANPFDVRLVSDRVGNYQAHPHWGVLVGQLWVR
ncbi:MAG TPA: ABC transporter substrate-binding protein [Actinomycetota bacterium]